MLLLGTLILHVSFGGHSPPFSWVYAGEGLQGQRVSISSALAKPCSQIPHQPSAPYSASFFSLSSSHLTCHPHIFLFSVSQPRHKRSMKVGIWGLFTGTLLSLGNCLAQSRYSRDIQRPPELLRSPAHELGNPLSCPLPCLPPTVPFQSPRTQPHPVLAPTASQASGRN